MKSIDCCPICSSPDNTFYYKGESAKVRGNWFDLSICHECGHYFLNPQPSWEELEPFYHSGYSPYSPAYNIDDMDSVIEKSKESSVYRHVNIKPGMKVLDVGCGGGTFLYVLNQMGATTLGIEPSLHGVNGCKEMGVDVYHGDLSDYINQNEDKHQFDLITANHVVEHHPNPIAFLSEMRSLLKPNGTVWISVPNGGYFYAKYLRSKWHSLDLPYHLMHFNLKSTEILIEKSGLKLKNMYTYSLERAVLSTFKSFLRKKYFIPIRVLDKITYFVNPISRRIGKRLDENNAGEAIIVEATLPPS